MSCFHPKRGIPSGFTKNGRIKYKMVPLSFDPRLMPGEEKVLACGQCIGCRLNRAREWADRMLLELQYHDSAYFVTLTYNDKYLPRSWYVSDTETGEVSPSFTLDPYDLKKFLWRLNKAFCDDDLRYYACGEYGEQFFRPHYHAIIFGLHLQDLVPYKKVNGYQYYTSQSLQDVWSIRESRWDEPDPIGYVVVGEVTWESCAYVARYVTKKLYGEASNFYSDHGIVPEFTRMSNRPGIGAEFLNNGDIRQIYESDLINIATPKGGKQIRPPSYFDRKFDLLYPDEMREIREKRERIAKDLLNLELDKTDLDFIEYMENKERKFKARVASLKRGYENGET